MNFALWSIDLRIFRLLLLFMMSSMNWIFKQKLCRGICANFPTCLTFLKEIVTYQFVTIKYIHWTNIQNLESNIFSKYPKVNFYAAFFQYLRSYFLAACCHFLLSDASSTITGNHFVYFICQYANMCVVYTDISNFLLLEKPTHFTYVYAIK